MRQVEEVEAVDEIRLDNERLMWLDVGASGMNRRVGLLG
jgi:hypothetical protein